MSPLAECLEVEDRRTILLTSCPMKPVRATPPELAGNRLISVRQRWQISGGALEAC